VRPALNTFRRVPALRAFLAVGVLLAFGLSVLVAASHSLHQAVHGDARDPGHQCVAMLLSRDHVLPADSGPVVGVRPAPAFLGFTTESLPALVAVEFLLSPPRAPPVRS